MTKNSRAQTQFGVLTPRMAILKAKEKGSVGEDVEILESVDTADEHRTRRSCCGKQYGSSSEN